MSAQLQEHIKNIQHAKRMSLKEPQWFFDNIVRTTIDDWQLVGVEALADVNRFLNREETRYNHEGLNRISMVSCHGPGKTHWLAQVMHWWNWCFVGLVVCTAPKEGQLKTRLWPRYRQILRQAVPAYRQLINVDTLKIALYDVSEGGEIQLNPDWGCIGETASDPENMAGYHDTPQLILVDEASGKRLDPMFPVLDGTLTTPGSCLAQIGNPTRTQGEFYDAHNKKTIMRLFFDMHIVPTCRKKEIELQSCSQRVYPSDRVDPKWVTGLEDKYGKDSPVVKIRAYGLFADMEPNQLIALDWMEDQKDIVEIGDGSIPKLRLSIDVADGGMDFNVITVANHYDTFVQMKKQTKHSFPPSEAPILIAKKAIAQFRMYGGRKDEDDFVVDALGVGAGTAGYLIDKGYRVVAHKGGRGSDNPDKWRNRRTQIYIKYRDIHRDGKIRYSPDFADDWEEYTAQVCSIKTNPNSDRVDDIETKQSMILRGVKSPDRADSGSMQCAANYHVTKSIIQINEALPDMESAGDF